MPKLSPTMEEGTIVKWHVAEGQKVEPGQVLMEVATDKANLEYQALDGGYLRKILVEEGSVASVNDPVAVCSVDPNEEIADYLAAAANPIEASAPEEPPEPVDSSSTESVSVENTSSSHSSGKTFQEPAMVPFPPLDTPPFSPSIEPYDRICASPLAKKLAADQGLDLASVKGSGPNGRILVRDLEYAQKNQVASLGVRKRATEQAGSYEEITPTPMRKAIGRRLQEAKTFIPHFYIHQDVQVSRLKRVREELKSFGVNLTFNDFVVKAVALALKEHPNVNSGYNSVEQKIVQFRTVDIAIAVTLPEGLITPIVRYADYKTIGEISQEVKSLAKRAKTQELSPEEYQGGSFTISNLGMFGVSDFVAIINPPQSAILSVSGIEKKPVVEADSVTIEHVMRITLSADHRTVDGVDGAKFIKMVQKLLENPAILLL